MRDPYFYIVDFDITEVKKVEEIYELIKVPVKELNIFRVLTEKSEDEFLTELNELFGNIYLETTLFRKQI